MKYCIKKIAIFVIAVSIFMHTTVISAYAGDSDWLLTQGMQDVLLIGEIVDINDQEISIKTHTFFPDVSMKSYVDNIKVEPFKYGIYGTELDWKEITDESGTYVKSFYKDEEVYLEEQPAIGDYVFVSADEMNENIYRIANTLLRIDGIDPNTARFYTWSENNNNELTIFTYFIRNGGKKIYYQHDYYANMLYINDKNTKEIVGQVDLNDIDYAPVLLPSRAKKLGLQEGTVALKRFMYEEEMQEVKIQEVVKATQVPAEEAETNNVNINIIAIMCVGAIIIIGFIIISLRRKR